MAARRCPWALAQSVAGTRACTRVVRLTATTLGLTAVAFTASVAAQTEPVIGLITKTDTNPFFVKMKEGAAEAARANGAKLLTGAGKGDGDNAGQVTAMENMIAAGAKAIQVKWASQPSHELEQPVDDAGLGTARLQP